MIDIFLLMLSVAAHAAPDGPDSSRRDLAKPAEPGTAQASGKAAAPPAFLAPTDKAAAPPVFLAPADSAAAPPVFLAPGDGAAALRAEPQVPTGRFTIAAEVKPILAATRGNWVAVREFDGQDLLYVTHLWSWRCGLVQMKLGVNGAEPEIWPMPECHLDMATPNAIHDSDGPPWRAYPLGSVQQIEVQLTFDDLDTDSARFDRRGVQIP